MLLAKTGETRSFAVGHFSLGYVLSKASTKLTKTNINLPVIFTLSVIPDTDLLFPFLKHRGPMHSIIMAFIVFIPIFAIYRKKAIPYLIALIQHPLIGDYIAGGQVQLLWPLTTQEFGTSLSIRSQTNITIEWITFLAAIIIMLKTKDIARFLQPHKTNLILLIPTFTVLLPTFTGYPLSVPIWLVFPHLVYLTIFTISMIVTLYKLFRKHLIH